MSDFSGLPRDRRFKAPPGEAWRTVALLMTAALVLWTTAMAIWAIASAVSADQRRELEECLSVFDSEDLCRSLHDVAVGWAVGSIVALWFVGFVVLSLVWLIAKLSAIDASLHAVQAPDKS